MIQMDISGNECDHAFVVDYIDIDPDRSQQIIYCEKCYKTISEGSLMNPLLRNNGFNKNKTTDNATPSG